jgi:arylsulfatase A
MAELLKDVGYKTAMFGKSHLGFSPKFFPNRFGFDAYYGSLGNYPIGDTCVVWENDKIVDKAGRFQDVHAQLTDRTIAFMKESKKEKKPFFIYLSHYLAHGPWAPNRQFATDEEWKIYQNQPIRGHLQNGGHIIYPALIRELDWHVGQVMTALKELSLDEKTLVFFISDNGPWLPAGSAWPLGGSKFNTYEGGHRVPAIARWPGTVPAGLVSDKMMSTMDVFPTVAALAGGQAPDDRVIDGKDARAVLMGGRTPRGTPSCFTTAGSCLKRCGSTTGSCTSRARRPTKSIGPSSA